MNVDTDSALPEAVALAGGVLVAVGTYLPWVVASPTADVVPAVYLAGMEQGIAGGDYLVLATLVVGLAASAYYRDERRGGYLVAGTGALVVVLTVVVFLSSVGGFLGAFVPGAGVVLTVLGGLLLLGAGWRRVVADGSDGAATGGDPAGASANT